MPTPRSGQAAHLTHDGLPHSIRFHWLKNEGKGRGTDMTYVYSPGRGLVHLDGNE
ncbi:MAG TPA: hypothetical protein VET45_16825 [Candidatus Binatia bacterium]|nr:hypothetical protein [Candidatus Binatia bacterium]